MQTSDKLRLKGVPRFEENQKEYGRAIGMGGVAGPSIPPSFPATVSIIEPSSAFVSSGGTAKLALPEKPCMFNGYRDKCLKTLINGLQQCKPLKFIVLKSSKRMKN